MVDINERLVGVLEKIEKKLSHEDESIQQQADGCLDVDQLASRWNVSKTVISDLKSAQAIPFIKIKGCLRFPLKAIQEYEKQNTVVPTTKVS